MNKKDDLILYRGILEIIRQIMEKSAKIEKGNSYIYRGEPRTHLKASSGLYRSYENKNVVPSDIEDSQKSILDKIIDYLPDIVRESSSEDSKSSSEDSKSSSEDFDILDEILAQLQHYGAKTNLIDFTTDYLIALFFACEKEPSRDGRVILLKRKGGNYKTFTAPRTINRAKSQKSVFVQSPTGFIEPTDTDVVRIPHALKKSILKYLDKCHDISAKRIYDDIHGFIKSADTEPHHLEIDKAERKKKEWEELHKTADGEKGKQKVQEVINEVVACYETALKLEKEFLEGYSQLGNFYFQVGDYNKSIEVYSRGINSEYNAELYAYRGKTHNLMGDYDRAVSDYNAAIEIEENNVLYHYERCQIFMIQREWKGVESDIIAIKELYRENFSELEGHLKQLRTFSDKNGIKLPVPIISLLEQTDE